jgi:PadR family transcriptional regulator, regulatory protein PadR
MPRRRRMQACKPIGLVRRQRTQDVYDVDNMPKPAYLGEFEQQVLLVVVRLGSDAYGPDIGRELEARAGRRVSRGALYTTFDRLEDKGLLRWRTVPGTEARDGLPRRLYTVTAAGLVALRAARDVVRRLWDGLDVRLKDPLK